MKRYLLFAGDNYYPIGGWDDFKWSYDSLDKAETATKGCCEDWWHIIDAETGKMVAESNNRLGIPETPKLKRFILFASNEQNECYGSFDSTAEAMEAAARKNPVQERWHIIDTTTGEKVSEFFQGPNANS